MKSKSIRRKDNAETLSTQRFAERERSEKSIGMGVCARNSSGGFLQAGALLLGASMLLSAAANAQVTAERLRDAAKEPQNWLMYSGDYAGRRYSTLEQINTSNAAKLVPKWVYQTMAGGKFETTPLVVDGILYCTGPDNAAYALDARSARPT